MTIIKFWKRWSFRSKGIIQAEYTRQTESSKVMYSHRPPILFSSMFSAIPADAFKDCDACFPSRFRINGNLFNLWLEVKSKIQTEVLDYLLYTDCAAKNVLTEKMQETMDRISQVCDNYDLTIRTKNIGVGYNQHMESPKWNQPSQWLDKDCKLLIKVTYLWGFLSTSVPLMMRSQPELLKPV